MFMKDNGFSFYLLLKSLLGFSAQLMSASSDALGMVGSFSGSGIVYVTFEVICF